MSSSGGRFPLAVHGALAAALLALWVSSIAAPVAIFLMGAALAVAVWRERRGRRPPRLIERLSGFASFLYLAFFLADLLILSGNLLYASMRLLTFLTILRVLGARTDRDRVQLLLVSFLSVVAAAASTTQIGFAAPLMLYISAALWALMCRQADLAGGEARPLPADLARRSGAALLVGLAIFFLIPHVGTGYFRSGTRLRQEVSGFSGRIELGSINRIKKNHEIVMRIRVSGSQPPGAPIRWRGRTFDEFDGRAWSQTEDRVIWMRAARGGTQLGISRGLPRLEYEVTLEPIDTPFLFVAPDPLHLETNHFLRIGDGSGDGLRLEFLRRVRIRYKVVSGLLSSLRMQGALMGAGTVYPPEISDRYLQLPNLDPRIQQVADELSAGAGDPYEVAEAIERGLRSGYTYTLDVRDAGVADPIGRFLLERAPGHCEYFATSMALLMRLQGIPTRVVTGFQRGSYSDLYRTYLVRQSDAHSWVEVYFPGRGWVGFDPTPAEPVQMRATLFARLQRGWERVEIAWDTWIIGLDLNDQASVLGTARDAIAGTLAGAATAARELIRGFWSLGGLLRVGGLLLLAAMALLAAKRLGRGVPHWMRRWLRRPGEARPDDPVGRLYARFLEVLASRGIPRKVHQTPLEFARSAGGRSGMPDEVAELTDLFCRARYGAEGLGEEPLRRAERLLRQLRTISPS